MFRVNSSSLALGEFTFTPQGCNIHFLPIAVDNLLGTAITSKAMTSRFLVSCTTWLATEKTPVIRGRVRSAQIFLRRGRCASSLSSGSWKSMHSSHAGRATELCRRNLRCKRRSARSVSKKSCQVKSCSLGNHDIR